MDMGWLERLLPIPLGISSAGDRGCMGMVEVREIDMPGIDRRTMLLGALGLGSGAGLAREEEPPERGEPDLFKQVFPGGPTGRNGYEELLQACDALAGMSSAWMSIGRFAELSQTREGSMKGLKTRVA